jgi:hypothetical protein
MNSLNDKRAVVTDETYVILGATGNTGSIIADTLLLKGKKVRVVGRDAGRLQRFVRKGADGSVPEGYLQMFPNNGGALPLATGQVYAFIAETTGAQGAQGFFFMSTGGPIQINVPGLCPSAFVGDVKPVKCGTNEAFVEPKDLEEFARENRVQK